MEKRFVAALSQSGSECVGRDISPSGAVDPNTGKQGLRVRQGPRTSDEAEANELKDQLNQLLAHETFWSMPDELRPKSDSFGGRGDLLSRHGAGTE